MLNENDDVQTQGAPVGSVSPEDSALRTRLEYVAKNGLRDESMKASNALSWLDGNSLSSLEQKDRERFLGEADDLYIGTKERLDDFTKDERQARFDAREKASNDIRAKMQFVVDENGDDKALAEETQKAKNALGYLNTYSLDSLTDAQLRELNAGADELYGAAERRRGHFGVFVDSLKRGNNSLAVMVKNGLTMLKPGELTQEDMDGIRAIRTAGEQYDFAHPKRINGIKEIGSAGDVVDFVSEAVGENLERTAVAVAGSMLGAPLGAAGAIAGSSAAGMFMNTGEAVQDQLDENVAEFSRGLALAQGALYGAAEGAFGVAPGLGRMYGKILRSMGKEAAKRTLATGLRETGQAAVVKNAAKEYGKMLLGEAAQEPLQSQVVGRGRRWIQTGTPFREGETGTDAWWETADEAAGAFAAALVTGGIGAGGNAAGARRKVNIARNVVSHMKRDERFDKLSPEYQMLIGRHAMNDALLATNRHAPVITDEDRALMERQNADIERSLADDKGKEGDVARSVLADMTTNFALEDRATIVEKAREDGTLHRHTNEEIADIRATEQEIEPLDGKKVTAYYDRATRQHLYRIQDWMGEGKDAWLTVPPQGMKPSLDGAEAYSDLNDALEAMSENDAYNRARAKDSEAKRQVISDMVKNMYKGEVNLVLADGVGGIRDGRLRGIMAANPSSAMYDPDTNTLVVLTDKVSSIGEMYTAVAHEGLHKEIADYVKANGETLSEGRKRLFKDGVYSGDYEKAYGRRDEGEEAGEEAVVERSSVERIVKALNAQDRTLVGAGVRRVIDGVKQMMGADTGLAGNVITDDDVRRELNFLWNRGDFGVKAEVRVTGNDNEADILRGKREDAVASEANAVRERAAEAERQKRQRAIDAANLNAETFAESYPKSYAAFLKANKLKDGAEAKGKFLEKFAADGHSVLEADTAAVEPSKAVDAKALEAVEADFAANGYAEVPAEVADAFAKRHPELVRNAQDGETVLFHHPLPENAPKTGVNGPADAPSETAATAQTDSAKPVEGGKTAKSATSRYGNERQTAFYEDFKAKLPEGTEILSAKKDANGTLVIRTRDADGKAVDTFVSKDGVSFTEAPKAVNKEGKVLTGTAAQHQIARTEEDKLIYRFIKGVQENPNSMLAFWMEHGKSLLPQPNTRLVNRYDEKGAISGTDVVFDDADAVSAFFDGMGADERDKWMRVFFGEGYQKPSRDGTGASGSGMSEDEVNEAWINFKRLGMQAQNGIELTNEEVMADDDFNDVESMLNRLADEYSAYEEWKKGDRLTNEERVAKEQEEAAKAREVKVGGDSYDIEDLEANALSREVYDSAVAEVERNGNAVAQFARDELDGLKAGDVLRFDHADADWVVESWDGKAGEVVVTANDVADNPLFTEEEKKELTGRRFRITERGWVELNGNKETKEAENGTERKAGEGADEAVGGDAEGKRGGKGEGKPAEAEGKLTEAASKENATAKTESVGVVRVKGRPRNLSTMTENANSTTLAVVKNRSEKGILPDEVIAMPNGHGVKQQGRESHKSPCVLFRYKSDGADSVGHPLYGDIDAIVRWAAENGMNVVAESGDKGGVSAKSTAEEVAEPSNPPMSAKEANKVLGMDAALNDRQLAQRMKAWEAHAKERPEFARKLESAKVVLEYRKAKGKADPHATEVEAKPKEKNEQKKIDAISKKMNESAAIFRAEFKKFVEDFGLDEFDKKVNRRDYGHVGEFDETAALDHMRRFDINALRDLKSRAAKFNLGHYNGRDQKIQEWFDKVIAEKQSGDRKIGEAYKVSSDRIKASDEPFDYHRNGAVYAERQPVSIDGKDVAYVEHYVDGRLRELVGESSDVNEYVLFVNGGEIGSHRKIEKIVGVRPQYGEGNGSVLTFKTEKDLLDAYDKLNDISPKAFDTKAEWKDSPETESGVDPSAVKREFYDATRIEGKGKTSYDIDKGMDIVRKLNDSELDDIGWYFRMGEKADGEKSPFRQAYERVLKERSAPKPVGNGRMAKAEAAQRPSEETGEVKLGGPTEPTDAGFAAWAVGRDGKPLSFASEAEREQSRKVFDTLVRRGVVDGSTGASAVRFRREENAEYRAVEAKYRGTDRWMKAPNGKPTNLTERQWVQVRTPSFKAWFGDWDDDPANASKVVDENGEPLVVYHGSMESDNTFNVFDNESDSGIYFSADYEDANRRGGNARSFFLNARKGIDKGEAFGKYEGTGGNPKRETIGKLRKDGYDYWTTKGGEIAVFSPEQIKSATDNTGAFDGRNADIRFRRSAVTPAEDAAYMDAVKRGDMETARRMVREAAAKAMPNTKVVDKDGLPLVVYHGSPHGGHTIFNGEKNATYSQSVRGVTFFSSSRDVGESYSTNPKTKYADLPDGLIEKAKAYLVENNVEVRQESDGFHSYLDGHHIANSTGETKEDSMRKASISVASDMEKDEGSMVYSAFVNISDPLVSDFNGRSWKGKRSDDGYYDNSVPLLAKRAMAKGHDGLIVRNVEDAANIIGRGVADDYAVFSPSQIKSADPVTYDDAGNVIPLSRRFDGTSADIRFRRVDTKPFTKKEMDSIVSRFGETSDLNAAGWLLPDGRLVDFNRDYHREDMNDWIEHGEILSATPGRGDYSKRLMDAIEEAASAGGIRFANGPSGLYIDIFNEPTDKQYDVLDKIANHDWWQDELAIKDFGEGHVVNFGDGKTISYDDNIGLSKRLVSDVRRHFSGVDESADSEAVRMFHGDIRFRRSDGEKYPTASADDPNVAFGSKEGIKDKTGYERIFARIANKDVMDEGAELARDAATVNGIIGKVERGDAPSSLDLATLIHAYADKLSELDGLRNSMDAQNGKARAGEEEALGVVAERVFEGLRLAGSRSGHALQMLKMGIALKGVKDTYYYLASEVKALKAKQGLDPELTDAERTMLEAQAKELKAANDRLKAALDAQDGRIAELEEMNRTLAEFRDTAKRRISDAVMRKYDIGDAVAVNIGIDGLSKFFRRASGARLARTDGGAEAVSLNDEIREAFASVLYGAKMDGENARAMVSDTFGSEAASLFDGYLAEIGADRGRDERVRVASGRAKEKADNRLAKRKQRLDRKRNDTIRALDAAGDDVDARRKAVAKYLRDYMKYLAAVDSSLSNEDILKRMAEEANAVDPRGNYTSDDMLDAVGGKSGYDMQTREETEKRLALVKRALALAQAGKKREAAELLGVPYDGAVDELEKTERRLKKMLERKEYAKMDLLENPPPDLAEKEAEVARLEAEVKETADLIQTMRTEIAQAEKKAKVIAALQQQLDARQKELAELGDGVSPERKARAEREIEGLKRDLSSVRRETNLAKRIADENAELERRIRENDFEPPARKPRAVERSPEVQMLMERRDRLRKRLAAARKAYQYKKQNAAKQLWDDFWAILGESKAIAGSLDFSSMFRQGGQLTFAHPLLFARNFKRTLAALKSEENADAIMREIMGRPNAKYYAKAGIDFTDWGEGASSADDRFAIYDAKTGEGRWLLDKYHKVVKQRFVKAGVNMSERAFAVYLNLMRADVFDYLVAHSTYGDAGRMNANQLKALGNFVNVASQRGMIEKGGNLGKAINFLNYILWSPRNVISRFQFLWETAKLANPLANPYGDRTLRRLFAAELARYLGGMAAMIAFAKFMADLLKDGDEPPDDIELDPRSSQFLRVKFGNTRVDFMSGLAQVVTFLGRWVTRRNKNSRGQLRDTNFAESLGKLIRTKLSPAAAFAWDFSSGETFSRQDIVYDRAWTDTKDEKSAYRHFAETFVPLTFSDLAEQAKYSGVGNTALTFMFTLLGAGVNAYDPLTYKQMTGDFHYYKRLYAEADEDGRKRLLLYHPMLKRAGSIEAEIRAINKIKSIVNRRKKANLEVPQELQDALERRQKLVVNLISGAPNPSQVD